MASANGATEPAEARPGSRRRAVAAGLVLVAATLAAYIPALRAGYVWDDDQYLYENDLVQRADGLAGIWRIRYDGQAGRLRINTPQYYPLVFTSFWLEHRLWGLAPAGYHTVNVLLHALSALLVWRIGHRLGIPAAWFVAAVFALHPVHVESVAWITERKNVLSGLLYLLALLAALNYLERGRTRSYVTGLALFVAALLSKTVTCSLPVVILLIRWYQRRRITRRVGLLVAPMLIIGLAAGLLTAYVERVHVGAIDVQENETLFRRALLVAPRAFWFYAGKMAWPHPLIFIYPRWEIDTTAWAAYVPLAGAGLAAAITLLLVRRLGRSPFVLLAYSAVTLSPALGFFEVYPHRFSWVADHFQYLGSLGFVILYTTIVVGLGRRLSRSETMARFGRAGGVCVLVGLAVLTYQRSRSYASAQRLWEDTLAANPDAWIASLNLALGAAQDGRYDEAAEYFEYTARFPVSRAAAYGNWGVVLLLMGSTEGAIAKLETALELDSTDARIHAALGTAYHAAGRFAEAEAALQTAVRLKPGWLMSRLNLSQVYTEQGRWREAERCLRQARRLSPYDHRVRIFSGRLLARRGRWNEAVEQYRAVRLEQLQDSDALAGFVEALSQTGAHQEALQVCIKALEETPDDADLLRHLAWLRATAPVASLRDGAQALGIATRLLQPGQDDPLLLDTLACAYAESGNFAAAVATAERALDAARRRDAAGRAEEIEARLELFRAGLPYRQSAP